MFEYTVFSNICMFCVFIYFSMEEYLEQVRQRHTDPILETEARKILAGKANDFGGESKWLFLHFNYKIVRRANRNRRS